MDELGKIYRVIDRELPYSDREIFLVLDATTGQNAISQAKEFMKVADVTGIVLTKLDGTARGGVVLAIKNELKLPVKFIGVGEGLDDLQPFSATAFAESLFDPISQENQEEIEEKLDENLDMGDAKDVEVASLVREEKKEEQEEAKEEKAVEKDVKKAAKEESKVEETVEKTAEKTEKELTKEEKKAEKQAAKEAKAAAKAAAKKAKAEEKARRKAEKEKEKQKKD